MEQNDTLSVTEATEIEAVTDEIDDAPNDATLWFKRAGLWLKKGDVIAAISDYTRAAEIAPNDPKAWKELFHLYSEKGLTTKAARTKSKINLLESPSQD